MNKQQKEILQSQLSDEQEVLKKLKGIYRKALDDINGNIAALLGRKDTENLQSIIYQVEYQKSLKNQISGILDTLSGQQFNTIAGYLSKSYEEGFLGTLYDLHGQGIPLLFPIDQNQVVRALQHDTKLSKSLYESLHEDVSLLKKRIQNNISRGIAQGSSYTDISRNIAAGMVGDYSKMRGGALGKAYTIVRTEGHRITNEAAIDAQKKAKEKGADVVKQWDSTIDKKTRPHHRQLDGQIRELDEPFEINGNTAMYPGGFGIPAEDINCRCAVLQRARWALDDKELEELKKRAEYFGLDKTDSFEDYKKKYLQSVQKLKTESEYSKVELGELESAYGKKHSEAIRKRLQAAPEEIQKVWDDCAGDFHVLDPQYKGERAYYSPSRGGVKLNITTAGKGSVYQTPYQTVFHEYGHHSDYVLNRKYGNGDSMTALSETYKDGIFGRTLKEEGYDAIRTWAKNKGVAELPDLASRINGDVEKLVQSGIIASSERAKEIQKMKRMLKFSAYIPEDVAKAFCADIRRELTLMQRSDISDMFEPIMPKSCSYPFGVGHEAEYWIGRDNGKEGFAEMFSAAVSNPESLEQIKKFFPKSYEIFKEMLGVVE